METAAVSNGWYNQCMRIIIVEDEKRLSDSIKKGLVESGFAVDQAYDGEEGLFLCGSENYDCIILDIMLPKIDGLSVCRQLREKQIFVPIIMLTAKTTTQDITRGLDTGADDYLAKPFSFVELKSRIQALIRRNHKIQSTVLMADGLELDTAKHTVKRFGKNIILTPKEFSILELLMRHKDETLTRTMIIEHVWDYNYEGLSNVVDVFVATLRKKIDRRLSKKLIHTVHGVGFKISEVR